jgi:hypothetical protein
VMTQPTRHARCCPLNWLAVNCIVQPSYVSLCRDMCIMYVSNFAMLTTW